MQIDNFKIGQYLDPYIIAEIGVNHANSMALAERMIDEAAEAGAHAAKFQTYKAERLASRYSPAYWDTSKEPTSSQFALFKKFDSFGPQQYKQLADYCERRGIHFLSTPFHDEAVDELCPLVPAFKIASADITNVPLLRKVAETGKPIIMSTGASTIAEVEFAVTTLRQAGAVDIALLHCVLNYPTPPNDAQLWNIAALKRAFPDTEVGYSDHVPPLTSMPALELAALQGAVILEKHFTYDKSLEGNDHYHAMDKSDLASFTDRLSLFRTLQGTVGAGLDSQRAARQHARRSIVADKDLKAGHVIRATDITVKRPAHGISPIFWDDVIGAKLNQDVSEDRPLAWRNLERSAG
ncbi:N,N'-diacetyllegionaminic acid synthase [Caballeronia calidae]|uniref:N,N'-diacetyllegionaminic acid synthase n=1 Tax=Caballeronia calidae TaxID=1777139 RepID=A0A158BZ33_9BURK|nr:N-acetylneuraminate synthase family protein [Caballeronia calidae]SAK75365.1 N,N'-diacetyllegionaminic acid synthase [Caballeronia calidae]